MFYTILPYLNFAGGIAVGLAAFWSIKKIYTDETSSTPSLKKDTVNNQTALQDKEWFN